MDRLTAVETRPTASQTQPELRWVDHAWRDAVCVVFSLAIWQSVAGIEWREHRTPLRRRGRARRRRIRPRPLPPARSGAHRPGHRRDERPVRHRGRPRHARGCVGRDQARRTPGRAGRRGELRGGPDLDEPGALPGQRPARHDARQPRGQRRDDGLGPLHRHPARGHVEPPRARRAGRDRAGAAAGAGPVDREGAHRPRDARRAGPPHHPDLDAGRGARVPRRPRR